MKKIKQCFVSNLTYVHLAIKSFACPRSTLKETPLFAAQKYRANQLFCPVQLAVVEKKMATVALVSRPATVLSKISCE